MVATWSGWLAEGELDLALIVLPLQTRDPALTTTEILREPLVVAAPADGSLLARRSIRVRDLARHPLVMYREGYDLREVTFTSLRREGVEPRIAVEGGELDAVLSLVEAGLGVAVVPSMVVDGRPGLRAVPFVRPGLSRTIGFARRRDVELSATGGAFRRLLEAHLAEAVRTKSLPAAWRSSAGLRATSTRRRSVARDARPPPTRHDGEMDETLAEVLTGSLRSAVVATRPVHGGDVARSYAVDLADGRRVFAKTHPGAPPDFFTTEATGLALAASRPRTGGRRRDPRGARGGGRPAEPSRARVDRRGAGRRATTRPRAGLGRALAGLHAAGAPGFGREDRRTTGSRGLPNEPAATWAEFYADRRLLPLGAAGRATPVRSPPATVAALERVADRLDELGDRPSRPPGCTATCGRATGSSTPTAASWLIDPAAHGGHREFDLAMMRLFGGFGAECFAAYAEVGTARRRVGGPGRAAPDRSARGARDQVRRRLRRRRRAAIDRYV